MKNFLYRFRLYKTMKSSIIGEYYRFCWIPFNAIGGGVYTVIEFQEEELHKIDKNKCEILIF